ncbi:unnamed protein product [Ilex paraguariensis]|uniref:Uncharacterized protein n=1 Tax=Ilex paraguariensis TaxID=185542 RepID=A0ABC8S7Z4_9AQUA
MEVEIHPMAKQKKDPNNCEANLAPFVLLRAEGPYKDDPVATSLSLVQDIIFELKLVGEEPAVINVTIDPVVGTKSGRLQHKN